MSMYSVRSKGENYLYIIIGTIFMAIAVNLVYEPLGMVTGGVTGIGIVIKHYTGHIIEGGIPVWLTNIALNIPLFAAGLLIKGAKFLKNSIIGAISLTVALYLIPVYNLVGDEFFLAAVFGGVFTGIGLGMVISASGSTGGTDLLCVLIRHYFPHLNFSILIGVVDGIIVLFGAIVFGIEITLYAIVALYITSKFSDNILEGLKFAKVAFIISDKYNEIGDRIITDLDRGVTGLYGQGMYTKTDKNVLFCVVSKKQISQIIQLVSQIDPKAFVIVSDVREVMGEGFIEYEHEN